MEEGNVGFHNLDMIKTWTTWSGVCLEPVTFQVSEW